VFVSELVSITIDIGLSNKPEDYRSVMLSIIIKRSFFAPESVGLHVHKYKFD
jgi:hypothetical protein